MEPSAGDGIAQVEALIKAKVSVSSIENLHRFFQLGGLDPFLIGSRVVKLLLSAR